MLKFFNILKLIFKEKTIVKSYYSDDDLEQFVSRRINSKLEVNKTQKHENELLKITINNLNKQILDFKNEVYDQKQIIAQYNIDLDEIEFLRLNLKFLKFFLYLNLHNNYH